MAELQPIQPIDVRAFINNLNKGGLKLNRVDRNEILKFANENGEPKTIDAKEFPLIYNYLKSKFPDRITLSEEGLKISRQAPQASSRPEEGKGYVRGGLDYLLEPTIDKFTNFIAGGISGGDKFGGGAKKTMRVFGRMAVGFGIGFLLGGPIGGAIGACLFGIFGLFSGSGESGAGDGGGGSGTGQLVPVPIGRQQQDGQKKTEGLERQEGAGQEDKDNKRKLLENINRELLNFSQNLSARGIKSIAKDDEKLDEDSKEILKKIVEITGKDEELKKIFEDINFGTVTWGQLRERLSKLKKISDGKKIDILNNEVREKYEEMSEILDQLINNLPAEAKQAEAKPAAPPAAASPASATPAPAASAAAAGQPAAVSEAVSPPATPPALATPAPAANPAPAPSINSIKTELKEIIKDKDETKSFTTEDKRKVDELKVMTVRLTKGKNIDRILFRDLRLAETYRALKSAVNALLDELTQQGK